MLEILMIYTAITLILVPIFRFQGAVHGYSEAKEYLFVCLSALAFIVMLFTGIPVLTSTLDWLFLAFVAYITLSAYWSDNPSLAVKDVPRWWGIFLFYLACSNVPRDTLIMALFLPAPAIVIYGMYQQIMKRDPLDHWVHEMLTKRPKKLRFYSFLGNSNYCGSYLVGSIFAGVYCTAHISLWFTPVLALTIVGIAFTRCRGAWAGVILGFLGVMPELWPIMLCLFSALAVISWKRYETAVLRVHFLNVGWMMFKERFLFGWGCNGFRRKLFKTQGFMNQQDPRILGTLKKKGKVETPIGRRMHNDHAEMFVEFGLIGAGLWFTIIVLGMMQAVSGGHWYVAGGILAISLNALFFYPIRVVGIGLGFWVFLGLSGSPEMPHNQFLALPLYLSVPFSLIVALLAWEFAVKRLLAIAHMYNFGLALRAGNKVEAEPHLKSALELDPLNGGILCDFAAFYRDVSPPLAFQTVMRAVDQYDGEKIEYSLWVQLGTMAAMNGAAEFSRVCFRMAIYLNPAYGQAYKALDELEKMIAAMSKKLGKEPPPGFKQDGDIIVPNKKIEIVK